jgi:hypothetical protein
MVELVKQSASPEGEVEMDAKQGNAINQRNETKTATRAVSQSPTPNAMLDVWWLLVNMSHVKDGAGWLPNCIPAKREKRRSAAYPKE